MFVIFLRAVILYVLLLIVMRLMGKRQIGEMQPFEFIITLLIAELACIPMTDISIPLSYGIVSLLAIFILHQAMSLLERLGTTVKFIISGKPSLVITPNGVDLCELRKNNLDIADLAEALRALGYFAFDEVEYALFESNGKLSAIKKEGEMPPSLPLILINSGKIQKENFAIRNISLEDLKSRFKNHFQHLKEIEVATMDENGKIYFKKRNSRYEILYYNGGDENC